MKTAFSFIVFFFCFISYSQVKTYTKAQLDSMAKVETVHQTIPKKDFQIIEKIPIYKGCEKEQSNSKKIECMSQKILNLVSKHFNTTLPRGSQVSSGKIRVSTNFIIDESGNIIDIEARGPDIYLENEANRVISLLPKFTPGYQNGNPVKVPYALPIIAVVKNINDIGYTSFPVFRGCSEGDDMDETKECSIQKIKDFIKISFDYDIANAVLPLEKSTQFQLDFIINKKGKVESVNAKANHRAIAIEAIRVAKRIPKFKASGKIDGKPVDTPFSLLMTIYF